MEGDEKEEGEGGLGVLIGGGKNKRGRLSRKKEGREEYKILE